MKKCMLVLFALALALSLCACGKSQPEEVVQMGNPVQEVGSPEEMQEKLNISIDAPEGAENVRYSVISGTIGQVQYTLNGTECCFRVSAQKEDISGVYGSFREDTTKLVIEHNVQRCETEARYTTEGGAVANWTIADLQYSLYATEASDWDVFGEMVKERMLDQLDSMEQAG